MKVESLAPYPLANIIKLRKNAFGIEALIDNREEVVNKYPNVVIDHASIDDIMLYYVKGDSYEGSNN